MRNGSGIDDRDEPTSDRVGDRGRLAAALVGPGSELLEMAGRERLRLAVVAVSIVVLAVLSCPPYGSEVFS